MHIFGTISSESIELLESADECAQFMDEVVAESGATNLGRIVHKFDDGGGFTVVMGLAESHVALHTWPEFGRVTLDVYLCNYKHDNTKKCEMIYDRISKYFEPTDIKTEKQLREPYPSSVLAK